MSSSKLVAKQLPSIRSPAKSTQIVRSKIAKKPAVKRSSKRPPDGYEVPTGALVAIPEGLVKPVPLGKIQASLENASHPILSMAKEFASRMEGESFSIKEIEFSVSFDANGKFLGVGVGGAASMRIVIAPSAN